MIYCEARAFGETETGTSIRPISGISIVITSAPDLDPTTLAASRYLTRASAALVVFDGSLPDVVEVFGRDVDLVWLDGSMSVRLVDERMPDGSSG